MWEKAEIMFPQGHLPTDGMSVEELKQSPIQTVRLLRRRKARDMDIEQYDEVWTSDNQHYFDYKYQVYDAPSINMKRHLSVYGAKMLSDVKNKEIMENEDVGFNYTGIQ